MAGHQMVPENYHKQSLEGMWIICECIIFFSINKEIQDKNIYNL